MEKIKIAICIDLNSNIHSTSWYYPWEEYCQENNLEYEILNPYSSTIIDELKKFDILLWHFNNYTFQDMMMARSILYSAKMLGLKIFPDFYDIWHFDDKIAETYLLQSIAASIPQSWLFYSLNEIKNWDKHEITFPLVAKLKCGSGSHNVKLIKSKSQLIDYSKRMFGNGFSPHPSIFYKAKSNYDSSKGKKDLMMSRIKKIPEFYNTYKSAKKFPNEKGYVFLQEFIPNNGYDLKIVVIGEKLSFIVRRVRKNDFRASGGGDIYYDKTLITKDIIDSAFAVNDKLKFLCMGYDYVINSKTNEGKIIEMSYCFSHVALLQAKGYFDRNGIWYDRPLNAPEEILKNILLNK
jgi:glutathione synthase/RimK-type ligase-like ATP-grasp enzyme